MSLKEEEIWTLGRTLGKVATCKSRREASEDPELASALILNFSASRTVRE